MAETLIEHVIVPEVFAPYVINKSVEKSVMFDCGLVTADPRIDLGTRNGGETVNMPYWNDIIDGDAEELSDKKSLTPANISAGQDIAVLQALGKAFSVNDLAGTLAGSDPAAAIGDRVAEFWARNMHKRVISTLTGIAGAASMSGNLHDISALTANSGAAAKLDKSSFADAVFLLGDVFGELSAVACHSLTYAKLYKDDLIDTVKGSDGQPFPTYQGKRVIVNDSLPIPSSGVYLTFLFGMGAFGYAEGQPKVPVETGRAWLAGRDELVSRRHFILHPRGIKWVGSAKVSTGTDSSGHPTSAELATSANWTRVYDSKQVRIVTIKHKL